MRIAIVEDRKEDQKSLRSLLFEEAREREWVYIVENYSSGEAFLSAKGTFDIVFLDVMMGGIDGLETARRFRENGGNALVILVTVDSDFAIEGYEVEAAAFLIKPVRRKQLHRVLDRLAHKLKPDEPLSLSDDVEIPAGLVLFAIASDHCLKVHTAAKNYFPGFNLEELRRRLPDDGRFVECHRGIIVNIDRVNKVETKFLLLEDGSSLPVSRRRRQLVVDGLAAREFKNIRSEME